jgi:hypothetical protein
MDEVPDSTWFTNRIGARDMTVDEVRAGPSVNGSPEEHKPWTILRNAARFSITSVGLFVRDARGVEFFVKFDEKGFPELETNAGLITNKLLWAAGYNVPEEYVVDINAADLLATGESRYVDTNGAEGQLTREHLDKILAKAEVGAGGVVRAHVSRIIEGTVIGPHAGEGTRKDDPNDRIPHELRRDLRGAYAIFAWLDQIDAKAGNSLDVWVQEGARHYVKHYLLDFGKSLGVYEMMSPNKRLGMAYHTDGEQIITQFVTLGFADREWNERSAPPIRGVGLFDAENFDPGEWKPSTSSYRPFAVADARDNLWGAKIVMSFKPEQIRAIVESARFSDPQAVDYLTAVLIERQRKTARYWFDRASPLERFAVEDSNLCFDDLEIDYGFERSQRYEIVRHDRGGNELERRTLQAFDGRRCFPLTLAPGNDGYTIVSITSEGNTIDAHIARDPGDGRSRVIGIWRR